ncbi:hypothetical protein DW089_08775 [Acidaminococcus sp. AM05-11]|jgi:hypothetical protein|nr:hypothetical protein DW089_08775 [Acidaminococcus sp. AM05-11]
MSGGLTGIAEEKRRTCYAFYKSVEVFFRIDGGASAAEGAFPTQGPMNYWSGPSLPFLIGGEGMG